MYGCGVAECLFTDATKFFAVFDYDVDRLFKLFTACDHGFQL